MKEKLCRKDSLETAREMIETKLESGGLCLSGQKLKIAAQGCRLEKVASRDEDTQTNFATIPLDFEPDDFMIPSAEQTEFEQKELQKRLLESYQYHQSNMQSANSSHRPTPVRLKHQQAKGLYMILNNSVEANSRMHSSKIARTSINSPRIE